jgi:hypothetical protein
MHVIRLRGPWNCEPLVGSVRYTRRFNCPTNLEPSEQVWLAFEGCARDAQIVLNDRRLGTLRGGLATQRIEITSELLPHNVLAVELSPRPAKLSDDCGRRSSRPDGSFGEVRLEIGRS